MSSPEELFQAADPVAGSEYVPSELDAMCTRAVERQPRDTKRPARSRRFGSRLSISVALAIALGGTAVGTELALGSSPPSPKAELRSQLNAVVAKYGRAVSTQASDEICSTIGMNYAQGLLASGSPAPTLVGNWSSDVAAIDDWLFDESVPTVPGPNPLGDFNEITDGTAPTSVCYFLGQYGGQLWTPLNSMSTTSLGVEVVLIANGHSYGDVTMPYPIPAFYETPPAG